MAKTELTENQRKFAALVAAGHNHTAAARAAGYSTPRQEGHRLIQDQRVRDLIFQKQELALIELGPKAMTVVQEIMEDASHKPEVRLQAAALTLREIGRVRGRELKDKTPLLENPRELSAVDLQAAIDKLLVTLKPSVTIDSKATEIEGEYVHPSLADMDD